MINLEKIAREAFIDELQKIAETPQLQQGIEIEKEHLDTIKKIKDSVNNDKVTMSNNDILKSIAKDHLGEKSDYYTLLKKHVEKKELKKLADINEEENAKLKLLNETNGGTKIYLVDADYVGNALDDRWIKTDNYVIGNHHFGEFGDYIPKDEIWISNRTDKKERPRVIFHELHELGLIEKLGINAQEAHKLTKDAEHYMELAGGEFPDLEKSK